jgi:hypothetical protein
MFDEMGWGEEGKGRKRWEMVRFVYRAGENGGNSCAFAGFDDVMLCLHSSVSLVSLLLIRYAVATKII